MNDGDELFDTSHSKRRTQSIESNVGARGKGFQKKRHFYCPYTKSKKFEVFLDDLFDLGFDVERNKKEIALYMEAVEGYYSDKTRDLYLRKKS